MSKLAENIEQGIGHIADAGKSLIKGLKSLGAFDAIEKKRNKKPEQPDGNKTQKN